MLSQIEVNFKSTRADTWPLARLAVLKRPDAHMAPG